MKVLLLNSILRTADNNVVPAAKTIKDCMIYNLGMGFKRLGHDVTLAAAEDFMPEEKEDYDFEVVFQKTSFKKIFRIGMLPLQLGLINYLIKNKKKFDLIISSEVFAMPSLFAVIIAPEKTVVWHEINVHPKLFKKILSKIWYNVIVKLFFQKSLIVPRSKEAKLFISKYVKYTSDIMVGHGVNLEQFICSSEKKSQFIVVSQLVRRKNIESIIQKFNAFIKKYNRNDVLLLIVGKGELQQELQDQINSLGIQDNVNLTGFKPHAELGTMMADSIAMLVDTKQDSSMVSFPESIVSGTPVITNLVPITATLISENNLGIAKDNWDENDLNILMEQNKWYVDSCINYRRNLSVEHSAQQLIENFRQFKK